MENNNKLIAEFMQKGSKSLGIYDFDGCHYRLDELKFHTSWDWLMPVIQKCRQENRLEYFDMVYYALEECDINVTYKAVVEFIKNQNN
tara:strand:+ start:95 stop:358 length:264 start_codon:yes stop_codon:yes gene_type:complete